MKAFAVTLLLALGLLSARAADFAVYDVYIDPRGEPLAAYQLKISNKNADVKIISVEGGEHPRYKEAPKFDPKAIQRDVIKMAAFSLDAPEILPAGRVRVAALHVEIGPSLTPEWLLVVETAARPG